MEFVTLHVSYPIPVSLSEPIPLSIPFIALTPLPALVTLRVTSPVQVPIMEILSSSALTDPVPA